MVEIVMNIFSIFRKKKPVELTVDERVVTPEFLNKHDIQIRRLINGKWAAWCCGRGDRGAIDSRRAHVWTSEDNIAQYSWCNNREEALAAAVRYLAAKGVVMPEPQSTASIPKPEPHTGGGIVVDRKKSETPHGGGNVLADY